MTDQADIRWHQRFSNYRKALHKLNIAVDMIAGDKLSNKRSEETEVFKEGLIQRFEYTYELAWNVMKDYVEYQGYDNIAGSRDATRAAFKLGLISEGQEWMNMLESRKLTTHTYNQETADDIFERIIHSYHKLFIDFEQKMEGLRSGTQTELL